MASRVAAPATAVSRVAVPAAPAAGPPGERAQLHLRADSCLFARYPPSCTGTPRSTPCPRRRSST
eukprot:scaffold44774_cov50-Phaeocystis_antarctica.AAC.2